MNITDPLDQFVLAGVVGESYTLDSARHVPFPLRSRNHMDVYGMYTSET